MKFKIIIHRWGNFYFFIQNLSEWHFSARKTYNELWRKELAPFSADEEAAIQTFKNIRQKYKTSRTFFEDVFFKQDNPLLALKNYLPSDESATLEKIFLELKNKFDVLYAKELPALTNWQNELAVTLNDSASVKKISMIVSGLFGTPAIDNEINIYLLLSAPNHVGGGANIDEKSISLEISRYPKEKIGHGVGVIWHETIHLVFQNHKFYQLLLRLVENDRTLADPIMEITTTALFPRGVIGTRLLNNKPLEKLAPGIDRNQAIELLRIIQEYIDSQKELDEEYVAKAIKIFRASTRK
jgi:hypothetical protein